MKLKKKVTIEFNPENLFKKVYYCLGISLFVLLIINIFKFILFPLFFIVLHFFLDMLKMYPLMSIDYKFFAGFVLLFIFYKVFETFLFLIEKLIEWIIDILNQLNTKEVKQKWKKLKHKILTGYKKKQKH